MLLVSLDTLGISPVRVNDERSLHHTATCLDISNVVPGPGSTVSQITQSDTLLDCGLGFLIGQLSTLLFNGIPHDRETEISSQPSCHNIISKCCALQVNKAKIGLIILHT